MPAGAVRTVFLPVCAHDAFCSICDAWGRARTIFPDPDDFDERGRYIAVTSLDWPLSITLVCLPNEAERFLENLSALPERSAAR
jgi:hypothetical protein